MIQAIDEPGWPSRMVAMAGLATAGPAGEQQTESPLRHFGGRRPQLSEHAWRRMNARGISREALEMVLCYGRRCHTRGACIYAIGRKEIERYKHLGLNLVPYEGIHVVCSPEGTIMTAYRNRSLRGLRPERTRRRSHPRPC